MKKILKNFLFPHEGNDYRPHLLKRSGILGVAVFSAALLFLGVFNQNFYSERIIGAIYPAVIATLTNENRESASLKTLAYNPLLEEAAKKKGLDMVEKKYFAHQSPDGKEPWDWIKETGYEYEYAGENLAINFSDSKDVDEAWMASPTHRANILNENFEEVGVAAIKAKLDGREVVFVVEMFGKAKPLVDINSSLQMPIELEKSNIEATPTTSIIENKEIEEDENNNFVAEENTVLGLATTSVNEVNNEVKNAAGIPALKAGILKAVSNPWRVISSIYVLVLAIIIFSFALLILYSKRKKLSHITEAFASILIVVFGGMILYLVHFDPVILPML